VHDLLIKGIQRNSYKKILWPLKKENMV
jgi:hypothetical protein